MAIKKNLMIAGSLVTIGASAIGVSAVSAASNNNGQDGLVSKIASTFNLNQDEVQKVFDENREEHQAEHKARLEKRLTKAVENGKISEDQKNLILAKMDENKAFFESLKDMSKSERKTALKNHREDMKSWAEENGIDKEYLLPSHHFGRHGGHGEGPKGHHEFSENE